MGNHKIIQYPAEKSYINHIKYKKYLRKVLANPKSHNLTIPEFETNIFSGLTSR